MAAAIEHNVIPCDRRFGLQLGIERDPPDRRPPLVTQATPRAAHLGTWTVTLAPVARPRVHLQLELAAAGGAHHRAAGRS